MSVPPSEVLPYVIPAGAVASACTWFVARYVQRFDDHRARLREFIDFSRSVTQVAAALVLEKAEPSPDQERLTRLSDELETRANEIRGRSAFVGSVASHPWAATLHRVTASLVGLAATAEATPPPISESFKEALRERRTELATDLEKLEAYVRGIPAKEPYGS